MKQTKFSLSTFAIIAMTLVWCAPAVRAAPGSCERTYSVSELILAARRLDGRVVCVRGVFSFGADEHRDDARVVAPEISSLSGSQAIGLIDWDESTGIDVRLYKPETIAAAEKHMLAAIDKSPILSFDLLIRGTVMYKKQLLNKAREVTDHLFGPNTLQGQQRDVELVFLEVAKVNGLARVKGGSGPRN